MALDKAALITALTEAFEEGMADPNWSLGDSANAMADAIDTFVRSAEVSGVNTNVVDPGDNLIGFGSQDGTGGLL